MKGGRWAVKGVGCVVGGGGGVGLVVGGGEGREGGEGGGVCGGGRWRGG